MRSITFDFLGQHRHGMALHQFLRIRKRFFVELRLGLWRPIKAIGKSR